MVDDLNRDIPPRRSQKAKRGITWPGGDDDDGKGANVTTQPTQIDHSLSVSYIASLYSIHWHTMRKPWPLLYASLSHRHVATATCPVNTPHPGRFSTPDPPLFQADQTFPRALRGYMADTVRREQPDLALPCTCV